MYSLPKQCNTLFSSVLECISKMSNSVNYFMPFFVEKQLHHLDVNLLPRREKAVNLLTKVVSKTIILI